MSTKTALETFEDRKLEIAQRMARLNSEIEAYDRQISTVPGGHANWGHAGTLEAILQRITQAEQMLASAREATSARSNPKSILPTPAQVAGMNRTQKLAAFEGFLQAGYSTKKALKMAGL